MELMEHQLKAIRKLGPGKILWGGVGSGKSATVLGYYLDNEEERDIYVITTAKKRDSVDWEREAAKFNIGTERDATLAGVIHVDSWNNIEKYTKVQDAFFVFDEQRVVGHGAWVKSFLKIAKNNTWVLLSATPGDTWMDYAPVFVANEFYRNITDFKLKHVEYEPFVKYPKIRRYRDVARLAELRDSILVEMPYLKNTRREVNYIAVQHDEAVFKKVLKDRWNVYEDEPIKDVAELFRVMRRVVNTDPSRLDMIRWLMKFHPRLIVFYTFNYELKILKTLVDEVTVAEWNGHQKDPVPDTERWVYLVQYVAGSEGWNCTSTNSMVLYSMTYSYKNFEQAMGRIDRLDTKFTILYYYVFVSYSVIDRSIKRSLSNKKSFNEKTCLADDEGFEVDDDDLLVLGEECVKFDIQNGTGL